MSDLAGHHTVVLRTGWLTLMFFAALSTSGLTADEQSTTPAATATVAESTSPAAGVHAKGEPAASPVSLITPDLSSAWTHFSAKDGVPLESVWTVEQSSGEIQLICKGDPRGFLLSRRQYENFELTFEWKFESDPDANSGVLVYTQNEPRLWPTSMQVQLHQPQAGCIFPSGDATSDNSSEAPPLAMEIGQWNRCRVISRKGTLSVDINDKKAGEVSGCVPSRGFIALQSEGARTHFRNLKLRELSAGEVPQAVEPEGSVESEKQSSESLKAESSQSEPISESSAG
ncbi:MAG: DUF1080 domain-containing protein [Planctomycetaceae bacterium]